MRIAAVVILTLLACRGAPKPSPPADAGPTPAPPQAPSAAAVEPPVKPVPAVPAASTRSFSIAYSEPGGEPFECAHAPAATMADVDRLVAVPAGRIVPDCARFGSPVATCTAAGVTHYALTTKGLAQAKRRCAERGGVWSTGRTP